MKPLPIGIESFKEIINEDYYYVDKTLLIKDLLDNTSKVTLFTRPRRFGKTLVQSMLQTFFEEEIDSEGIRVDTARYFRNTRIEKAGEKYLSYIGKFPVISLSLKSGKQPDFEMSYRSLLDEIQKEYLRHRYILAGDMTEIERKRYLSIMNLEAEKTEYAKSIEFLSRCLEDYHKEKVIIVIDEYDVPLENAYFHGFYEEMIGFIRSLFESALKTNGSLKFAVVTGCLRISKESIFTGLNHLRTVSVLDQRYDEYFGFTPEEVETLLSSYDQIEKEQEVKQWYDGYLFGSQEVYNPWSILNYVDDHIAAKDRLPKPYWSNTSSNSIVRELVENSSFSVKKEIEDLIADGCIEKPIYEDITYDTVHSSEDSLWNFLFFTGYLKKVSERGEEDTIYLTMTIPNIEVKSVYKNSILSWFDEKMKETDLSPLIKAMEEEDCETITAILSEQLMETISFFDYAENYYHGFLAGLLKGNKKYLVVSNRESGDGRPDLILKEQKPPYRAAIILEIKRTKTLKEMEKGCEEALAQIEDRNYEEGLLEDGYDVIKKYGVCFCRKRVRVKIPNACQKLQVPANLTKEDVCGKRKE